MQSERDDAGGHELVSPCSPTTRHARPTRRSRSSRARRTTYGEMAVRVAALAGGLSRARRRPRRRRRPALVQLPRVPRDASSPPTTSARSPCRSTGGSPPRRCATSSSTRAPAPSCATSRSLELADEATTGLEATLVRACVSRTARDGWTSLAELRATPEPATRVPAGGRRHPPPDVHVGHHGPTQGRHAHPRQPGVEEPRPHRRVRLHRAPTSGSPADRCTTSARSTSRRPR